MVNDGVNFINVETHGNGRYIVGLLCKHHVIHFSGCDLFLAFVNGYLCIYCSGTAFEIPVVQVECMGFDIHGDKGGLTLSGVYVSYGNIMLRKSLSLRFNKVVSRIRFKENGTVVEFNGIPCSKIDAVRRWVMC